MTNILGVPETGPDILMFWFVVSLIFNFSLLVLFGYEVFNTLKWKTAWATSQIDADNWRHNYNSLWEEARSLHHELSVLKIAERQPTGSPFADGHLISMMEEAEGAPDSPQHHT